MNQNQLAQTIPIPDLSQEMLSVGEMETAATSPFILEKRIACLLTPLALARKQESLKEDTELKKYTKHLLENQLK